MTKVFLDNESNKRKHKICKSCVSHVKETETLEADCNVGEDVESEDFCEMFESKWKGKKIWRKLKY